MRDRAADIRAFEAQLDEWDGKIFMIEHQAKAAKADAKARYASLIRDLRKVRDEAGRQVDSLRADGDDAWVRVQHAWRRLENTFREMVARIS